MELKEILGRRRTIRFYLPFRPVEREKIQKMLEAARRASCVGNTNAPGALVIWRDEASPEVIQAITPPLGYQQMQTAPVFILWYQNTLAYEIDKWVGNLKDLADQRRIGIDPEQTKNMVEVGLRPAFSATWKQMAVAPLAFMDVGQAVCQATLVAYDEGLGSCLMSSPRLELLAQHLDLPETAIPVCIQSVGYPAESWEAGGQTRKAPFESLFCEGKYGQPFQHDPAVDEELRREKMLQEEAPLAWRQDEMRYITKALGLEEAPAPSLGGGDSSKEDG